MERLLTAAGDVIPLSRVNTEIAPRFAGCGKTRQGCHSERSEESLRSVDEGGDQRTTAEILRCAQDDSEQAREDSERAQDDGEQAREDSERVQEDNRGQVFRSLYNPIGSNPPPHSAQVVWTSALTGKGIPELKEKILEIAAPARDLGSEGEIITSLRHQQLLKDSLQALTHAHQAAEQNLPHEMLLLDLYEALRPLDQITGATYVDDVLDIIFSTFCVGK